MNIDYVIGVDFGSDSVRAMLTEVHSNHTLATAQFEYPRWKQQLFCDPDNNVFRQHPLDYIEGLQSVVTQLIQRVPNSANYVRAISIDTTGSTPVAVDTTGKPLALLPQFAENPNAMFILWKDHSAIEEAQQINDLAHQSTIDYTTYSGGIYSSEWFWAKALHVLNVDEQVAQCACSFVEHSDWMPALLCEKTDPSILMRNRCAAGHKAMWHSSWGGFPPSTFFQPLSKKLATIAQQMPSVTYTADSPVGHLAENWAKILGLNTSVLVGVGLLDAHCGAIGGEIKPGCLTKVMGTSTCDMLVYDGNKSLSIPGICGQVDGSILPNMIGLEAGQSAFGDVFAWFKNIILWSTQFYIKNTANSEKNILDILAEQASCTTTDVLANDWLNGRRTPFANPSVTAQITQLTLGTTAPQIYRALVEATAFGSKAILEHLRKYDCAINEIAALGGVAKKSTFVMQVMADILQVPIKVVRATEACSLGACMMAAIVAKLYPSVIDAQKVMGQGFEQTYVPNTATKEYYDKKYAKYVDLCQIIDKV